MILRINPTTNLRGEIFLPASKSYSIRAAIMSSFSHRAKLQLYSNCDDALVALNVIKQLGSKIFYDKKNRSYVVTAQSSNKLIKKIDVRESGTTLRFILPILALRAKFVKVTGKQTLIGRPNHFLVQTLRNMGAQISGTGENHSVPIKIGNQEIHGGKITIDGSLSSQFISALFITCPLLREDSTIYLTGKELVSTDYLEMTINFLELAGIQIKKVNNRTYFIKGRQKYKSVVNYKIPSDYGLAAFLLAAAALTKSNVKLKGYFHDQWIQADGAIMKFLKQMGVKWQRDSLSITIRGPFELKGGEFSLKSCPDLVPIMAVLALFAKGKTRLKNIKHARAKESDRISDLRKELLKVGADVRETQSDLTIIPRKIYKTNVSLDPHHDHRLAMAFAVLGLKLGVTIKDAECTYKSYPDFFKDFSLLKVKIS